MRVNKITEIKIPNIDENKNKDELIKELKKRFDQESNESIKKGLAKKLVDLDYLYYQRYL